MRSLLPAFCFSSWGSGERRLTRITNQRRHLYLLTRDLKAHLASPPYPCPASIHHPAPLDNTDFPPKLNLSSKSLPSQQCLSSEFIKVLYFQVIEIDSNELMQKKKKWPENLSLGRSDLSFLGNLRTPSLGKGNFPSPFLTPSTYSVIVILQSMAPPTPICTSLHSRDEESQTL